MMNENIKRISANEWEIEKGYIKDMRVPGIVYGNEEIVKMAIEDGAADQVANVACLPGIVEKSMAMPDIHSGYGFPIGGVAAFETREGIVSPGGVGYDISCGVRLMKTGISEKEAKNKIERVTQSIFSAVPCGKGKRIATRREKELRGVCERGVPYLIENGEGREEDAMLCEMGGVFLGADMGSVSEKAIRRGAGQLGTLGSGNHFIEIQKIVEIYNEKAAGVMNLFEDQIIILIHSGSRGFGHQICTDYVERMIDTAPKYGIEVRDPQLCCAPIESEDGKEYLAAMKCAANFAVSNRHMIMKEVERAFERAFNSSSSSLGIELIYDISHNVAREEKHIVKGELKNLLIHRKGATRAFGPGGEDLPEIYKAIGQPVMIPGDMGTGSYLLIGTSKAEKQTFGSTCHGAGRLMSRTRARKTVDKNKLIRQLKERGVHIAAASKIGLCEEAPEAYKDIETVVNICESLGISVKVARMAPVGVIKG